MRRLAAALALAALLASPALASADPINNVKKPYPAVWSGAIWDESFATVESQSIGFCCGAGPRVWNPDFFMPEGCAWDTDDRIWGHVGGSYMNAGQTVTGSICKYADWSGPSVVCWQLNYPGLTGTLRLRGEHADVTLSTTSKACIAGPEYHLFTRGTTDTPLHAPEEWDYSASLTDEVVSSNGGVAERYVYEVSVTNVSGKRIRSEGLFATIHLAYAGWAPAAAWAGSPYPWFDYFTRPAPGADPEVWTWLGP